MRLNLLLPKNLYNHLQKASELTGVTKAVYLRRLIKDYFKDNLLLNKPLNKQTWNLSENLSFNLKLSEELEILLTKASKINNTKKGEIIRGLLFLDLHKIDNLSTLRSKKEEIKTDKTSTLIQNIKNLLVLKNYSGLNNYLLSFMTIDKSDEIVRLGNPQFFIDTINQLEKAFSEISPELILFKIKMLWFRGNTEEVFDQIDKIKQRYTTNKVICIKAEIFKGEILADMGLSHKAKDVFEDLASKSENEVSNYYKVKINNKLGLSLFFIDNLEKIKDYYQKALILAKTEEELAIAHRYLASLYHTLEDLDNAEKHYSQSLEIFKQSKFSSLNEYSRLLITYAQLKSDKTQWAEAKALAEEGVKIAEGIGHMPMLAWGLRILFETQCYFDNGEFALTYLDKAIDIAKLVKSSSYLARGYCKKARYLMTKNRFNEANDALDTSRLYEKNSIDSVYNYNGVSRWQNYLRFLRGEEVHFKELYKQSELLQLKHHFRDKSFNDYILGFLCYSSKNKEVHEKGENLLKEVHYHAMKVNNKQLQQAVETVFKFNQLTLVD